MPEPTIDDPHESKKAFLGTGLDVPAPNDAVVRDLNNP
jgi:hypothetical protein